MPKPDLPDRRRLWHAPPPWVADGARYSITVCCEPRELNQLANRKVFGVMVGAIEHYVRTGRWWVDLFLAMPDHWHAVMAFGVEPGIEATMKDWKRFVARSAAVGWQDGFFDHRLRSEESIDEKWNYVLMNPVRKGLCARPEDWPWVWTPDRMK